VRQGAREPQDASRHSGHFHQDPPQQAGDDVQRHHARRHEER
jgi:ATP-dependent RNA helicase UAP56/SUB2